MSEIKYFTPEGLQKLKDELDDLILRERPPRHFPGMDDVLPPSIYTGIRPV